MHQLISANCDSQEAYTVTTENYSETVNDLHEDV